PAAAARFAAPRHARAQTSGATAPLQLPPPPQPRAPNRALLNVSSPHPISLGRMRLTPSTTCPGPTLPQSALPLNLNFRGGPTPLSPPHHRAHPSTTALRSNHPAPPPPLRRGVAASRVTMASPRAALAPQRSPAPTARPAAPMRRQSASSASSRHAAVANPA